MPYLESVWFANHGIWLCWEGQTWIIDDFGNCIEFTFHHALQQNVMMES